MRGDEPRGRRLPSRHAAAGVVAVAVGAGGGAAFRSGTGAPHPAAAAALPRRPLHHGHPPPRAPAPTGAHCPRPAAHLLHPLHLALLLPLPPQSNRCRPPPPAARAGPRALRRRAPRARPPGGGGREEEEEEEGLPRPGYHCHPPQGLGRGGGRRAEEAAERWEHQRRRGPVSAREKGRERVFGGGWPGVETSCGSKGGRGKAKRSEEHPPRRTLLPGFSAPNPASASCLGGGRRAERERPLEGRGAEGAGSEGRSSSGSGGRRRRRPAKREETSGCSGRDERGTSGGGHAEPRQRPRALAHLPGRELPRQRERESDDAPPVGGGGDGGRGRGGGAGGRRRLERGGESHAATSGAGADIPFGAAVGAATREQFGIQGM